MCVCVYVSVFVFVLVWGGGSEGVGCVRGGGDGGQRHPQLTLVYYKCIYKIICNMMSVLFVNHRESVLCQVQTVPVIACVLRAT